MFVQGGQNDSMQSSSNDVGFGPGGFGFSSQDEG
jgi:hypothetical protein